MRATVLQKKVDPEQHGYVQINIQTATWQMVWHAVAWRSILQKWSDRFVSSFLGEQEVQRNEAELEHIKWPQL